MYLNISFFPTLLLYYISFFTGIFLSAFLSIFALKFFPKWGLLDTPERYGHVRERLPYPFGIIFVISVLFGIFLTAELNSKIYGFLCAGIVLSITSFLDDKYRISPFIRLGVQAFCAGIVVYSGVWIEFLTNPFSSNAFSFGIYLGGFLSGIWILSLINTSNWIDGIPNLSLSSSALSAMVLAFLSISSRVQQPEVANLCFVFVGASIPLLALNIGRERYIFGDSGAMFAGFCIAIFSLFAGGKLATALIVMALPVLDAGYVILDRLRSGVSPAKGGDKRHLHDILLKKGWKKGQILILFLSVSTFLGASALFLDTFGKIILLITVTILFVVIRSKQK